jgi:DNA-binding CsgD family transcriptional regulator
MRLRGVRVPHQPRMARAWASRPGNSHPGGEQAGIHQQDEYPIADPPDDAQSGPSSGQRRQRQRPATALFTAATAVPGETDHPFEWARTRLVHGEWLRRQRRMVLARAELGAAAAAFGRAGATAWTSRATAELRAAGGAVDHEQWPIPTGSPERPSLTPQELQIARLAARGLSNKEIADQLFLSPRTVSAHLYRAYPKLGIRNRAELATRV